MASLITFSEGSREVPIDEFFGRPNEWLRLDDGQEIETVEALGESAWDRIESHISRRFIRRSFSAVVRVSEAGETIELPNAPIEVTTAEIFDASTGLYSPESFVSGPTTSSVVLLKTGIFRLTGQAGPAVPEQPPEAVKHAWKLLVAYALENRGDVRDDFSMQGFFRGCGAADLLKLWRRV